MKPGFLLIAILLSITLSLKGQQYVSFSYDNNGNRISRILKVTMLKSGHLNFPVDLTKLEEKQEENPGIKVYPNPVTTKLNIKIDGYTDLNYGSICLYSLTGKILYIIESLTAENDIDMTGFEDGIYLLRIVIAAESYSYKIVKNK